jgi:hypothetical protein
MCVYRKHFKFNLGDEVQDITSGYTGIIFARTLYTDYVVKCRVQQGDAPRESKMIYQRILKLVTANKMSEQEVLDKIEDWFGKS